MKNKNSVMDSKIINCILLAIVILVMSGVVIGQEVHLLTRGQYWFHVHTSGLSPTTGLLHGVGGPQTYPGIAPGGGRMQGENHFYVYGIRDGVVIQNDANVQDLGTDFSTVDPMSVTYNWDLAQASDQAEEYVTGSAQTPQGKSTPEGPALNVKVAHKTMQWSIPGYDHFVIQEFTVTNQEPVTLYNFHIMLMSRNAYAGSSADTEYIWDEERKIYIFYDDTRIDIQTGIKNVYDWGPGPVTGDVGNPEDIHEANAPNKYLNRSQALAFSFLDMPANKYGEQDPFYMLFSWNAPSGAPEREWPQTGDPIGRIGWGGYNTPDPGDLTAPFRILKYPQAKMSYRAAEADPTVEDGTLYERNPSLLTGIGPYDLPAGESISYKMIWCVGDIDRNDRMTGGVDITTTISMDHILDAGQTEDDHPSIKQLRENWDNALSLIQNNYTPAAAPPPTAGAPPEVELTEYELEAEPTTIEVGGSYESGIELRFLPVPDDYVDPITGADDFEGYKIYRSLTHPFGPYSLIDEVSKEESVIEAGRVVIKVPAISSVPYFYGVTSVDTDGNESGMIAYTRYSVTALPNYSNNPSDVRVVPNPFVQHSGLGSGDLKRLVFLNIPAICTIRIYTLAGDHVVTLEHDDGWGLEAWGSAGSESNYMLTKHRNNIRPGLYIYHIESHVEGHEGETAIGKFVVVK